MPFEDYGFGSKNTGKTYSGGSKEVTGGYSYDGDDSSPSIVDRITSFFTRDDDPSPAPQPVSGGRGNVYERPNERNDYLAAILQQQSDNAIVPPPNVPAIPQTFTDFNQSTGNMFQPVYDPQSGTYRLSDSGPNQQTANVNDITSSIVQYIPPNLRDPLMIGGQYSRSVPQAFVDNVVGLDDGYKSAGEIFGQQLRENPLGTLSDIGLGAAEGLYNLVTSPIDTTTDYFNSIYEAATRDPETTGPDQRLADLATVASVFPAAKVVGSTKVAKGLKGDLAEDYFGPDGPDVPPSRAGFRLPDNEAESSKIKTIYDAHKSLGLTDNQIQERTGIKRYAAYDVNGNLTEEVFGTTVPVDSLDISNVPYTVKDLKGEGGHYNSKDKEIVVASSYANNPKDLNEILRHEAEHAFQDKAGLIGSEFGSGGPTYQFFNQEQILRNNREAVSQINDEIKAAKRAGNFDNVAQLTQRKNEILANSEAVKNVDVYAGYMNSPIEVGARQAEGRKVTTYDPTVTAAELLDKGINPNILPMRLLQSFTRAVLPTHGGLAKVREAGPTVGDTKLLSGIAEALLPLADINTPRVASTRRNTSYPYLTPENRGGDVFQSSPSQRSLADDIQAMINSLNQKAPVVEFENQKGQMIAGGLSGDRLESALDNLAQRLNIERPDK